MKTFFLHMIIWDLKFFLRYHIVTIAFIITGLYTAIFRLLPETSDILLIMLIFSDPTFLGFLFIGVIILYEKSANTIQALSVTPVPLSIYIISKVIALTVIAIGAGFIMGLAGRGLNLNFGFLFLAIFLSSVLFIFLGMAGVSKVKSFNQYILVIPLFFTPAVLPLLELFGFFSSPLFYVIPTKASLILFKASFQSVPGTDIVYALVYLIIWIVGAFYWAHQALKIHWKNN